MTKKGFMNKEYVLKNFEFGEPLEGVADQSKKNNSSRHLLFALKIRRIWFTATIRTTWKVFVLNEMHYLEKIYDLWQNMN
jgi:hypothetical protein